MSVRPSPVAMVVMAMAMLTATIAKEENEKILSDACEALIGAVYIDRGYNYVKEFVLKNIVEQFGFDQKFINLLKILLLFSI